MKDFWYHYGEIVESLVAVAVGPVLILAIWSAIFYVIQAVIRLTR